MYLWGGKYTTLPADLEIHTPRAVKITADAILKGGEAHEYHKERVAEDDSAEMPGLCLFPAQGNRTMPQPALRPLAVPVCEGPVQDTADFV